MSNIEFHETASAKPWRWSPMEKLVARRAFEVALDREQESIIREAKDRIGHVTEASDLWALEHWLTEQRLRIGRTYDFRYSVLPLVFATLLRDGQLGEHELEGLAEEKLRVIRDMFRP